MLSPLNHVRTLTDDVGIIQHARYSVPNREHGYCTDDVARALIVMLMRLRRVPGDADARAMASTYLAFLSNAQLPDGRFHNFMSYGRAWLDVVGTQDSFGRAIWSLGYALRFAPDDGWRRICAEMLDLSQACNAWFDHSRAQAYAILGLAHATAAGHSAYTSAMRDLAQSLLRRYERERGAGWDWFEPVMTYDNARLPEALLRAGRALDDPAMLEAGRVTLEFLERTVFEDGIFVPIGNDGWFPRGGRRARFAQQPLEASAMMDAEIAAFDAFGGTEHRGMAARAAAWFDGKNLLGVALAHDGGCYDGLEADGPNLNMGAESTLAYLAAAYAQE